MAIGFGPGSDMVKSVNKQRSNRNKRSLKDSSADTMTNNLNNGLKFKNKASFEELAEMREQMQKQNNRNKIIAITVTTVLLFTIAIIVFSL